MFEYCGIACTLTSYAFYLGVAGETWWTAALFNVTFDFAFGIYATGSSHIAWI